MINKQVIGNAIMYCGDCLDVLPEVAGPVDAVIGDPPYGCTRNPWDKAIDMAAFWPIAKAVTKGNAAICLFSQQPFTTDLIESNRPFFRYDLIWAKPMGMGFLNARRMPLRGHEVICVFYQSLPTYNPQKFYDKPYRKIKSDIWTTNYGTVRGLEGYVSRSDTGARYPTSIIYAPQDAEVSNSSRASKGRHPTQKALSIMVWLVKTYTNEGETVLDPFMGSGTTGVAAILTGRRFIGIEKSPEYFEKACARLERATSDPGHEVNQVSKKLAEAGVTVTQPSALPLFDPAAQPGASVILQ